MLRKHRETSALASHCPFPTSHLILHRPFSFERRERATDSAEAQVILFIQRGKRDSGTKASEGEQSASATYASPIQQREAHPNLKVMQRFGLKRNPLSHTANIAIYDGGVRTHLVIGMFNLDITRT